jgi:MFS family permease
MQPVIGVLADRSKSRFGRRRPFMLAGCVVSVFAMMLLAWAREVAGWVGGGNGVAIALAVCAIYLIDFVSDLGDDMLVDANNLESLSMRFKRRIVRW